MMRVRINKNGLTRPIDSEGKVVGIDKVAGGDTYFRVLWDGDRTRDAAPIRAEHVSVVDDPDAEKEREPWERAKDELDRSDLTRIHRAVSSHIQDEAWHMQHTDYIDWNVTYQKVGRMLREKTGA